MSFAKRARDNYFTLNGRSSADWDIVCSNDTAYNAPARDVKAIQVPGRNGELHIDNGRWQNIDVEYNDCVIESDFGDKFDDFRAYCARLRGYQRLEDTFHPDEYRLADMTEGIKVKQLGTRYNNGRFDLTFNCKPQRFLKIGEEPIYIFPPLNGNSTPYFSGSESDVSVVVTLVKKPQTGSVTFNLIYKDMGQTVTETIGTASSVGWSSQVTIPYMSDWRIEAQIGQGEDVDDLIFSLTGVFHVGYQSVEYITGLCGRSIDIENPTGFRCAPVFEIYGQVLGLQNVTAYDPDGNLEESWNINSYDYSELTQEATMDCENEYVYYEENGVKNNLTSYMEITHSDSFGNAVQPSFPKLGSGKTNIYSYITNTDYSDVCIVLYPHWYTI